MSWFDIIKEPLNFGPLEDLKKLLPYRVVQDLFYKLNDEYINKVVKHSNKSEFNEDDYELLDKLFDEGSVQLNLEMSVSRFPYVARIDMDRYHSLIVMTLQTPEYYNSSTVVLVEPLWDYFRLRDAFEIINNNFKLGDIELEIAFGHKKDTTKYTNAWPKIQEELDFVINSIKRIEEYNGKPHDYKTIKGRNELVSNLWYNSPSRSNITVDDNFIYFLATFRNELGLV